MSFTSCAARCPTLIGSSRWGRARCIDTNLLVGWSGSTAAISGANSTSSLAQRATVRWA
jgi:hypothetical protein